MKTQKNKNDNLLHLTMFDVVGESILITTPHHRYIVLDTGETGAIANKLAQKIPFWKKEIDFLILSHTDRDHLFGAFAILDNYQVRCILVSGVYNPSSLWQDFIRKAQQKQIPIVPIYSRSDFIFDGLKFDFIAPLNSSLGRNDLKENNESLVLRLSFGASSILFGSDDR